MFMFYVSMFLAEKVWLYQ